MSRIRDLATDSRVISLIGIITTSAFLLVGARTLGIAIAWGIAACALLIAAWATMWFVRYRRAKQAGKKLGAMLEQQDSQSLNHGVADSERIDALKQRMHQAIQKIKTSKLGQLSGSEALYELPWYITVGNPAAGKSTAIINSGLQFPFDDGGQAVIKGIGGTRNCDWFFASEGILLDTAGRYAVQEEDRSEWLGFLDLLKKYRPRAPINGILVATSIGELASNEPDFALNLAKDIRQRVQELTERLEIFAPVYVLFTKADLLPGFSEFFADLDWTERDRVWGATMPYEHTDGQDAVALFASHFEELYDGLRTISVAQLSRTHGDGVSPELLTFPAEFTSIKPILQSFIATLFEENPFQFKPVFRGFYITSALQDAEAKSVSNDRIINEFGLTGNITSSQPLGAAQGYFLKRLFTDVVFPDQGLVRRHTTRARSLIRQGIVLGALCMLSLALAGWSWSHMNNLGLLENVTQDVTKAIKVQDGRIDLQSRLEALEILQDRLMQLENFNQARPLSLSLGLYQGEEMADKLRQEYFSGVANIMLGPVKESLEAFLHEVHQQGDALKPQASVSEATPRIAVQYKDARPSDVGDAYNALKTYLMLSSHEHIDAGHLSDQITRFWRSWLEANRGDMSREQMIRSAGRILSFHLEHASAPDWPTIPNNLALVDEVRDHLRRVVQGMPAAERVYGEIRARASTRFAPVTVASIVGPDNTSLVSGSHVVSGAMTVEAWRTYVQPAIKDAATNAQRSVDWVLQTSSKDDLTLEGSPEQIQRALIAMYKRDYAEEWKQFVLGISIAPFPNFPEAVSAMSRLGDTQTSPIGILIKTIFDQTAWDNPRLANVSLERTQNGLIEWFKSWVFQMKPSRVQADVNLSAKVMEIPLGPIGKEFSGFDRLAMHRDDGEPLLETYLKQLSKIRSRLNQLKNEGDPGPGALKLMRETLDGGGSELAEALKFVDEQMLIGIPDNQRSTLRPLLLRPLLQSYASIITPAAEELNKTWTAQVFELFSRKLATKYPFSSKSSIEASPIEISQVFGPEGAIAKYMESALGALVVRRGNTVTPRTWGDLGLLLQPEFANGLAQWVSPLEGGAVTNAGETGTTQAQTVFMLRPQPSPGITAYTLEIDGQKLNYRNGAAQWANFVWPNSSNAPGARITATTFDGKTVEVVNLPGRFGLEKMINSAQRNRQTDGSFRLSWATEGVEIGIDLRVISNTQAQSTPSQGNGQKGLGGLALPLNAVERTTASLQTPVVVNQ